MTDTLQAAPPALTAQTHTAYNPMPSISRLITELAQEQFWASYTRVRGDAEHFHPDYLADRRRTALLLRAVVADLFALADPDNSRAAADAGQAANAVRRADWLVTRPAQPAREWLREQYQQWEESPEPHPPNCPGGCGGSGEAMAILTWQADDGVPLHQEPVWCNRGEPEDPHGSDCVCHGSGFTYDDDHRERNLCLAYSPQPGRDDTPAAADPDDPWATGRYPGEEPPF
ncbi:hypothetical protein ACIHCQ_42210 [Streptomyces sp. NPDC052236]|uniref:hypothetical protein n=1 Tax=Streptomyces sp. NPDC052236 TaxID=3365686 RepID=UPI0037D08E2F